MDINSLAEQYKQALLADVLPFWQRYSPDNEHGGYFTCLDRQGRVYDSDKFVWLQARQAWLYSMLYNQLEKKSEWLDTAESGIAFLKKHGRDGEGNWYFSLDREGRPLVAPYNIFSDCFACMAFAQYGMAAGDDEALAIAAETYRNIIKRQDNPKGRWSKGMADNRPLKGFSLPMILCNLGNELRGVVPQLEIEQQTELVIDEVMRVFLDNEKLLIRESVLAGGGYHDSFEGRLTNPGHGIEAMWFIFDIARQRGDKQLMDKTVDVMLSILKWGWDKEYDGIFYFRDIDGKPPQQLEWDQKLWWVHIEALVALSMAWMQGGRTDAGKWYKKVHDYTWSHFPDGEYGEWFGYLNRRGEVLIPAKGGKWKGCFHIPRGLYRCWQIFANNNTL